MPFCARCRVGGHPRRSKQHCVPGQERQKHLGLPGIPVATITRSAGGRVNEQIHVVAQGHETVALTAAEAAVAAVRRGEDLATAKA